MNLLETLQAHKGSLIRLKTQLYWHNGRGYDGTPGRICLILDASTSAATFADLDAELARHAAPRRVRRGRRGADSAGTDAR